MQNPAYKLNVFIGFPSYGGNGGIQSEHPDIRRWYQRTIEKMKADPRIGEIYEETIGDTPVSMVRNRFVTLARKAGAHLLLMIDSDQGMLRHDKDPGHVDFWDAAFPEVYNHYPKGPLCIGAPYCGPPPHENVYVFQFGNFSTGLGAETRISLDQYTRSQAALMTGIQECAALPTGCILIDMRCFNLIEPSKLSKDEIIEKTASGELSPREAKWALREGFFYYEWNDQYADRKASTEDVTCTRDIALAGQAVLHYNPVRCAWDSWVGHWKPWNVGKPDHYRIDQIAGNFQRAVVDGISIRDKIIDAGKFTRTIPPSKKHPEPIVIKERWQDQHITPPEDVEALVTLVNQVLAEKPECRVLEIGSWLGGTAIPMADAGAKVTCIDTWGGTPGDRTGELATVADGDGNGSVPPVMQEFLNRIGDRHNRTIFPFRLTSQEAAKWHWHEFDIIFLDADHAYEAVAADIDAWLPHLAVDGIICGHDYGVEDFPGVKKAVLERFGSNLGLNKLGATIWAVIPALEPA
jgi:hypothetical protein